ncbi:MAG: TIGR00645 family protein [Bacteroidales bacterium]
MKKIEIVLEKLIFLSRWIQLPLFLGLIVGSVAFAYKFIIELIHLMQQMTVISEIDLMLGILALIDFVLVINLVFMVVIGGYSTFISKLEISTHEDRPEWLDKINANTLKTKLAASLVAISGIHLLKTFMNMSNVPYEQVKYQIIIHLVFLATTVFLTYSEKMMHHPRPAAKPQNH